MNKSKVLFVSLVVLLLLVVCGIVMVEGYFKEFEKDFILVCKNVVEDDCFGL